MSEEINYIDRIKIRGVTYYIRDNSMISGNLPTPDPEDEGGILRVVNGRWQIVSIDDAEGDSF